ncbi:Serine/threonine-protein kinase nekl-2 [Diplonema papillatum]|nr:Serine/threonine-protein kinase nekl-2 [Diplonema papillatum]
MLDAFEDLKAGGGLEMSTTTSGLGPKGDDECDSGEEEESWAWQKDQEAPRCGNLTCTTEFWLVRRRHHCRPCGRVFCSDCCPVNEVTRARQCDACAAGTLTRGSVPTVTKNMTIRAYNIRKIVEKSMTEGNDQRHSNVDIAELVSHGPPKKIFPVLRQLACGSFGKVFEAKDDRVGDRIAVKQIIRSKRKPREQEASIAREVVLQQKAVSRHQETSHGRLPFAQIYDLFYQKGGLLSQGAHWIIMELIEGETLHEYLATEYPVPYDESLEEASRRDPSKALAALVAHADAKRRLRSIQTLDLTEMEQPVADTGRGRRRTRGIADERVLSEFAKQLLIALSTVHEAGIVFRDLKPDNVMVEIDHFTEKRVLRLIDFGSAIEMPPHATDGVVKDKQLVGALAYMAPEVWDLVYSPKSDIWSLGCLMYEVANGEGAFKWVATKVNEFMDEMKLAHAAAKKSAVATARGGNGVNGDDDDELAQSDTSHAVRDLRARMKALLSSCQVYMKKKREWLKEESELLYWSEEFQDFVQLCFRTDMAERPSAAALLRHKFIRRYDDDSAAEDDIEDHYATLESTQTREYRSQSRPPMMLLDV